MYPWDQVWAFFPMMGWFLTVAILFIWLEAKVRQRRLRIYYTRRSPGGQ